MGLCNIALRLTCLSGSGGLSRRRRRRAGGRLRRWSLRRLHHFRRKWRRELPYGLLLLHDDHFGLVHDDVLEVVVGGLLAASLSPQNPPLVEHVRMRDAEAADEADDPADEEHQRRGDHGLPLGAERRQLHSEMRGVNTKWLDYK